MMTKEDIESKFEECFDDATRASEGGYGPDTTSKWGLWRSFEPIVTEYANQDKWISVKDRFPDKSGQYVVYGRYTKDCPMNVFEAFYDKKRKRFTSDYIISKDVTHWQPLPEPPKP